MPGGQINDPSLGKHYSLPFLPATPSSPSWTLEGLFELTRRPSWALDSPRALLPELQRSKDTVRSGVLGAEVSGHRQQQLTQTLIVHLLKTHFFTHRSLIVKSQQNKIELVTRAGPGQGQVGSRGHPRGASSKNDDVGASGTESPTKGRSKQPVKRRFPGSTGKTKCQ